MLFSGMDYEMSPTTGENAVAYICDSEKTHHSNHSVSVCSETENKLSKKLDWLVSSTHEDLMGIATGDYKNRLICGISLFDDEMYGFKKGSVYTISGESGSGKSVLATSIISGMIERNEHCKAMIVSMDMAEYDMARIVSTQLTGIRIEDVRDRSVDESARIELAEMLVEAQKNILSSGMLSVSGSSDIGSFDDFVSEFKSIEKVRGKIDVVLLDNFQDFIMGIGEASKMCYEIPPMISKFSREKDVVFIINSQYKSGKDTYGGMLQPVSEGVFIKRKNLDERSVDTEFKVPSVDGNLIDTNCSEYSLELGKNRISGFEGRTVTLRFDKRRQRII